MSEFTALWKFIKNSDYKSYSDYLESAHWCKVKTEFLSSRIKQCAVCKVKKRLVVHHKTYETLGCECDEDLVILCRDHHEELHKLARKVGFDNALAMLEFNREQEIERNRKQYSKKLKKKMSGKTKKKPKKRRKPRLQPLFR